MNIYVYIVLYVQVINLSLGVGLPLFFLCWNSPHYQFALSQESSSSLTILTSLLFIIICTHVLCMVPVTAMVQYYRHKYNPVRYPSSVTVKDITLAELSRPGALCLVSVWFVAIVTFIIQNEQ